ncbi:unnamed protein product [Lactuca saligna]|uniref:RRM domain-containing protein n=1 Tax=Lactuca saligna TaxID=75948 RepID=A0AA36EHU3_LACSI|nr:unnamed protein product [Lactuca saligna]
MRGYGGSSKTGGKTDQERHHFFVYDKFNGKNTVSFYFTNIPPDHNEPELWETFKKFGKIVDIFIARKKKKANQRFGLVRYLGIENVKIFEVKLNKIWLGFFKLRVNLARSQKRSIVKVNEQNQNHKLKSVIIRPNKLKSIVIQKNKEAFGKPSFVEVVKCNKASMGNGEGSEENGKDRKSSQDLDRHEINVC